MPSLYFAERAFWVFVSAKKYSLIRELLMPMICRRRPNIFASADDALPACKVTAARLSCQLLLSPPASQPAASAFRDYSIRAQRRLIPNMRTAPRRCHADSMPMLAAQRRRCRLYDMPRRIFNSARSNAFSLRQRGRRRRCLRAIATPPLLTLLSTFLASRCLRRGRRCLLRLRNAAADISLYYAVTAPHLARLAAHFRRPPLATLAMMSMGTILPGRFRCR